MKSFSPLTGIRALRSVLFGHYDKLFELVFQSPDGDSRAPEILKYRSRVMIHYLFQSPDGDSRAPEALTNLDPPSRRVQQFQSPDGDSRAPEVPGSRGRVTGRL